MMVGKNGKLGYQNAAGAECPSRAYLQHPIEHWLDLFGPEIVRLLRQK
jgi:hypothetical protein